MSGDILFNGAGKGVYFPVSPWAWLCTCISMEVHGKHRACMGGTYHFLRTYPLVPQSFTFPCWRFTAGCCHYVYNTCMNRLSLKRDFPSVWHHDKGVLLSTLFSNAVCCRCVRMRLYAEKLRLKADVLCPRVIALQ